MSNYFGPKYEQGSIDHGLAERSQEIGFVVPWWFFDEDASILASPYDEGSYTDLPGNPMGTGLVFRGPYQIPALSVTRTEGQRVDSDSGFYTIDTLLMRLPYRMAVSAGLLPPPDETNQHLKDRFLFDNMIWEVGSMVSRNLLGGGGTRAMITVMAAQITPDELLNTPAFARWARQPDNS